MKFIKTFLGVTLLIISSVLYGCLNESIKNSQVESIIPVSEPQYVELTLIEGKTTKQEIIDALGMPKSMSGISLDYQFKDDIKAKLQLIFKDGTKFNVILGDGEKQRWLSIGFDDYDENGNIIISDKNTSILIY